MEVMLADRKKFGWVQVWERGRGSREAGAEEAGKGGCAGKGLERHEVF